MKIRKTAIAPAIADMEQVEREITIRASIARPVVRKQPNCYRCGRPRKVKIFTPGEIAAYRLAKLWNVIDWPTVIR